MTAKQVLLVYDKQCPACDFYCNLVRIRDSVGDLQLIDARDGGALLDEITALGLDIDQGMVLKVVGQIYYGSDAIHALALMSTRSGFFNRLNYWIFSSERVSGVLYPVFRTLRNLLLRLAKALWQTTERIWAVLQSLIARLLERLNTFAKKHLSVSDDNKRAGVFARTWPIGSTALWIAVLLSSYVLVYYF